MAEDTRVKLLQGAVACLRTVGPKFTYSDVARASGVARQTIYAHFEDRADLLNAAVQFAALELTTEIAERTAGIDDPADALVETIVAFHSASQRDPAIAQVIAMTLHPRTADAGSISSQALQLTRGFLRRRVASSVDLDEVAETFLRMLLSVLGYQSRATESEDELRAYLHRRLIPALMPADYVRLPIDDPRERLAPPSVAHDDQRGTSSPPAWESTSS